MSLQSIQPDLECQDCKGVWFVPAMKFREVDGKILPQNMLEAAPVVLGCITCGAIIYKDNPDAPCGMGYTMLPGALMTYLSKVADFLNSCVKP